MTEWKRKENRYHMVSHEGKEGLIYLTFPVLDGAENVRHLFSTRKGGVSRGIYESMNLSFHRGDDAENVLENFRRIAALFDSTPDKIVCAKQTHTTNIRRVTKEDAGKGVTKEPDYEEIDGLVTNEPELILCTSFADCVPLYFVDPEKKAIGLAHSGWRGTVEKIGQVAIERMQEQYGTKPDDLLAAVGPCIGVCHFEVGDEVSEIFRETFGEDVLEQHEKWHVNLPLSVQKTLLSAGIPEKNITMAEICTYCHSDLLFSHRKTNGKRGNLGAFLALK